MTATHNLRDAAAKKGDTRPRHWCLKGLLINSEYWDVYHKSYNLSQTVTFNRAAVKDDCFC